MVANHAKRLLLLALMSLAAVNLFTGAPLFAIWVGSRVQGDSGGLSMTAVLRRGARAWRSSAGR